MGEAKRRHLALVRSEATDAESPELRRTPGIEVGRGDIAELTRRFGKSLKRDQEARRTEDPKRGDQTLAFTLVAYPIGWNHLGQVVEYEACTDTKVKPFDSYLRSRGPDVKSAERRMRWVIVRALVQLAELPLESAKAIARKAVIVTVDVLPRRPKEMDPA